jgi:hypothetical protein
MTDASVAFAIMITTFQMGISSHFYISTNDAEDCKTLVAEDLHPQKPLSSELFFALRRNALLSL